MRATTFQGEADKKHTQIKNRVGGSNETTWAHQKSQRPGFQTCEVDKTTGYTLPEYRVQAWASC